MSWNYNPATIESNPKDQVRFLIGDTDPDYAYLQDEEITYLLKTSRDIDNTAIACVRRIIAKVAKEVSYTIGPERVDATDRLQNYRALLESLLEELSGVGHLGLSQPATHSPIFDIGMNDTQGRSTNWLSLDSDWTR